LADAVNLQAGSGFDSRVQSADRPNPLPPHHQRRGAEKDDEEPAEYQDVAHRVFCSSAAVVWFRGLDWL
jgi:hypothetical protein